MALGIVLAPFGRNPDGTSPPYTVNYSGVNRHKTLCPSDPAYNTRGEPWLYYDTPLGGLRGESIGDKFRRWNAQRKARAQLRDIPTDAELAVNRGYTPVASGWISTVGGKYVTGPWLPPDGRDYSGYPPPVAFSGLHGLGDNGAAESQNELIASMNAHNDRVFALTLVSTAAVAVSAMIAIFRSVKLIHEGK